MPYQPILARKTGGNGHPVPNPKKRRNLAPLEDELSMTVREMSMTANGHGVVSRRGNRDTTKGDGKTIIFGNQQRR